MLTHYFLAAEKAAPGASYNNQVFTGPTEGETVKVSFDIPFNMNTHTYANIYICKRIHAQITCVHFNVYNCGNAFCTTSCLCSTTILVAVMSTLIWLVLFALAKIYYGPALDSLYVRD